MANRRARPSLLLPAWRAVGFAVGSGATALLPAEASAKVGVAIGRAVQEQYDANIRTMYDARIEEEESEVSERASGWRSGCLQGIYLRKQRSGNQRRNLPPDICLWRSGGVGRQGQATGRGMGAGYTSFLAHGRRWCWFRPTTVLGSVFWKCRRLWRVLLPLLLFCSPAPPEKERAAVYIVPYIYSVFSI